MIAREGISHLASADWVCGELNGWRKDETLPLRQILSPWLRTRRSAKCEPGSIGQEELGSIDVWEFPAKKEAQHSIAGTIHVLRHGLPRSLNIVSLQGREDVVVFNPFRIFLGGEDIETVYVFKNELQLIGDALVLRKAAYGAVKRIVGFDDLADLDVRLTLNDDHVLEQRDLFRVDDLRRALGGETLQYFAKLVDLDDVLDRDGRNDKALVLYFGKPSRMGVRLVLHCAASSTSGRKSPGRRRQFRIQFLRSP
jgi:hypothetical protein